MPVSEQELSGFAASHDIITLGIAADEVRRARHGARTTFVRVADVGAAPGSAVTWPTAAGEIRIVGTPLTRATAIARVAEVAGKVGAVPLSGFSLADLEQLAAREGLTLRTLLEELRGVGLELIAEAPFDRLADARRSVEEVNIAGLGLARLTVDRPAAPDHLLQLRAVSDLQRSVGVIKAFAPLPRHTNPATPTTGYEDVKRVGLARLVCENIPSIQVDWARYGPKLAQVALALGADDIDGVSPENETTEGRRRAPLEEIRRNIRAAGLEPVERNGRFDLIPA
jgi:hypothetical protein